LAPVRVISLIGIDLPPLHSLALIGAPWL